MREAIAAKFGQTSQLKVADAIGVTTFTLCRLLGAKLDGVTQSTVQAIITLTGDDERLHRCFLNDEAKGRLWSHQRWLEKELNRVRVSVGMQLWEATRRESAKGAEHHRNILRFAVERIKAAAPAAWQQVSHWNLQDRRFELAVLRVLVPFRAPFADGIERDWNDCTARERRDIVTAGLRIETILLDREHDDRRAILSQSPW
jgi:hypothetical protein